MSDFVRGDCHKCKFEITAECVPRSQKMGFPNCYQSAITNADRVRSMSDEELANFIVHRDCCPGFVADTFSDANRKKYGFDGRSERCEYGDDCDECWIDWLRQEAQT